MLGQAELGLDRVGVVGVARAARGLVLRGRGRRVDRVDERAELAGRELASRREAVAVWVVHD